MPKLRVGSGFTIFLLFFGISLLDAVRGRDWLRALLFFALGLVFLFAEGSILNGGSRATGDERF